MPRGNPPVRFDVAGAGDGVMESSKRARSRKRRTQPRGVLHTTAPVPDPTGPSPGAPPEKVEAAKSAAEAAKLTPILPSPQNPLRPAFQLYGRCLLEEGVATSDGPSFYV